MRNKIIILAVTALVVLILCAGCITDTPLKTTETNILMNMYEALDELCVDLRTLEHEVLRDLEILSREIPNKNESEIYSILRDYYTECPCFTAVIYRDTFEDVYISAPVFVDVDLSKYGVLTEQDFKDAGGMIIRNNIFTKYHGYQNLYCEPVYDSNGKYQGYVALVIDIYSLLYLHPDMIGQDKSYSNYICFIADENYNILYSSIKESTGERIPENGFYDGLAYIPRVDSGEGACKYNSFGFYMYDGEDVISEKITAWHTIYSSHGPRYTIYLIDKPNKPALKTENVFKVNAQQAVNDIHVAYIYANMYGKEKLIERINSGYYKTDLYLVDMRGDIIASSDKKTVSRNYISNRGMYGVCYMQSAIFFAEQGGGYIYYLTPAENTVYPRESQYTLGVVMPLPYPDKYFIYCRFAGAEDAVLIDKNIRPDITRLTHEILKETSVKGVEAVADIINSNRENAAEMFVSDLKTDIINIAILDTAGNV